MILLNIWNSIKKVTIYYTGLRKVLGLFIKPWKYYDYITDIDIKELKKLIKDNNIKLVIIDMDGVLKHRKYGILDENVDWIIKVKKIVDVYMITNANKVFAKSVASKIDVPYVSSAKKPSKRGFLKILSKMNVKPSEVIMIGDALVADIHGAKKVNIDKCILVKDLNIYDKKTRR